MCRLLESIEVTQRFAWPQAVRASRSGSIQRARASAAISNGTRSYEVATPATEAPTSFFGSVELDALRLSSSAGQVGTEILAHLTSLLGANVTVRLEIEAHIPGGVPDAVLRTVTENARTLKFRTAEFE